MQLKKLALCLGTISVLMGGIQAVNPTTTFAQPFVTIDYGEHQGNMHVWWSVDKGSAWVKGSPPKRTLCIHASLENGYNEVECRDYSFRQKDGQWYYQWNGFTGKHAPLSSGFGWKKVSKDKLANDILYIALQK